MKPVTCYASERFVGPIVGPVRHFMHRSGRSFCGRHEGFDGHDAPQLPGLELWPTCASCWRIFCRLPQKRVGACGCRVELNGELLICSSAPKHSGAHFDDREGLAFTSAAIVTRRVA